jgi:hypothetical protein
MYDINDDAFSDLVDALKRSRVVSGEEALKCRDAGGYSVQVKATAQEILSSWLRHDGRKYLISNKINNKLRDELSYDSWISKLLTDDRSVHPLKEHGAASTKVNIFLRDLVKDVLANFSGNVGIEGRAVLREVWNASVSGLYNDQMTATIMWAVLASKHVDRGHLKLLLTMVHDQDAMKSLSTYVKSCGIGSDIAKAVLVELGALAGRSVGSIDVEDEWKTRTDEEFFKTNKAAEVDMSRLRQAINQVMDEELKQVKPFQSKDDYWSKRWLLTKAGGHQRRVEKVLMHEDVTAGMDQPTRRMFAEAQSENVLLKYEAMTLAGMSEKLEPGKTRAIYSCDTVSYYHFDYILRHVERFWRNKNVLLNPASTPQSQLYARLAAHSSSYMLMLDYDDFNSQHTIEAMQLAWDVLMERLPHSDDSSAIGAWCRESLSNQHVYTKEHPEGAKSVGSLFSGHRATTFFNSILNRAYVLATTDLSKASLSLHAGDDIILVFQDAEPCARALLDIASSKLRMNKAKQGIGFVSGDFLRVAFDSKGAVGYLARAVSTVVAGNWTTEEAVGGPEYAKNLVGMAWTLANRSAETNAGLLLLSSVCRRVPALSSEARGLLLGQKSLNKSPVRGFHSEVDVVQLVCSRPKKLRVEKTASFATDEYLSRHCNIKLIKDAGIGVGYVRRLMLEASFKPKLAGQAEVTRVEKYSARVYCTVLADNLESKRAGMLEKTMPFAYLRGQLSDTQLIAICRLLGMEEGTDMEMWAWGSQCSVTSMGDVCTWAEACSMSGRTLANANVMYPFKVAA